MPAWSAEQPRSRKDQEDYNKLAAARAEGRFAGCAGCGELTVLRFSDASQRWQLICPNYKRGPTGCHHNSTCRDAHTINK